MSVPRKRGGQSGMPPMEMPPPDRGGRETRMPFPYRERRLSRYQPEVAIRQPTGAIRMICGTEGEKGGLCGEIPGYMPVPAAATKRDAQ